MTNDQVREVFAPHVVTRTAALLCDQCGGYHRHDYDDVDALRNVTGEVENVFVYFRCVDCGSRRQWGAIGPHVREWNDESSDDE